MEIECKNISDEDYVLERARLALKSDPISAKAWMITAKTLYPNNLSVQFEAYCIEKDAGHVKEAAKCFSDLIVTFRQQPILWTEIEKLTTALRAESDTNDPEKQFLCEMFRHISSDVQHRLLLLTADHCEDTMEHCRLLLLLLQRFPTAIASYGPRLVDTLMSAEKHSHDPNLPINPYRKLLVCDLLPLLGSQQLNVELQPKLLYKLLNKAIEFYLCYLGLSPVTIQEGEAKVEDPWKKLFEVTEFIGNQLGWEPYLINFSNNWSKETYWQKILSFCQSQRVGDDKQILFCLSIFFLNCLHEYNSSLTPESAPGQVQTVFILTEAFLDPSLPSPVSEPKSKKRKIENEALFPYITVEKPEQKNIYCNFLMALNCWDLLHSSENLQREFSKLNNHLKLDSWLSAFAIDYAIYKGRYDDALVYLHKITEPHLQLSKNIRMANIMYIKKKYSLCFEHIVKIIPLLPDNNIGCLSTNLIVGGNQRHLHYLPLTKITVLQFAVKLLLRCIKENIGKQPYNELAIGHIFILAQMDWPQEEDFIPPLLEQIQQQGSFHYILFQAVKEMSECVLPVMLSSKIGAYESECSLNLSNIISHHIDLSVNYVVNVDLLEEITYLWTKHGGQITLDIIPHLGQRRIGTRGADKGAKEEIKQAIRRQIARSNDDLDELMIRFISHEKTYILQTLV